MMNTMGHHTTLHEMKLSYNFIIKIADLVKYPEIVLKLSKMCFEIYYNLAGGPECCLVSCKALC